MANESAAIPLPPKATVPFFYKYSSLASPQSLERLRVIIQGHELYVPNLEQLNDPADGRPRLAPLSEEQMSHFLYLKLVQRSPHLSPAELDQERAIIDYNVKLHGTKALHKDLTEVLHSELKDYRIYSMSQRYDNLSLWAKYAGDHSGYCLEFANKGPLFENARDVMYEHSMQMDVNNPEHTMAFGSSASVPSGVTKKKYDWCCLAAFPLESKTGSKLVEAVNSREKCVSAERADGSRPGRKHEFRI